MLRVYDVLCPDKRQMFGNVNMIRNTIAGRVCDMVTDLRAWLMEGSRNFEYRC